MTQDDTQKNAEEFEQLAKGDRSSFVGEFWYFLMHNKKWWLLPIVVVIGLLGVLVLLGGSPLAPFIYPLF